MPSSARDVVLKRNLIEDRSWPEKIEKCANMFASLNGRKCADIFAS